MSEIQTFTCPNCGASLTTSGTEKTIRCAYCGSSMAIQDQPRGQKRDIQEELTSQEAIFSPQHVDWLVQHGLDATVQVDFMKERGRTKNNNPVFDLHLVGKKANGEKFENMATLNVARNLVPAAGSAVKIKYNVNKSELMDVEDFVLLIGGQYIYCFPDDDSFLDG
jgi:DNA-directed RNA polymerase subunit RPC12/RpoP